MFHNLIVTTRVFVFASIQNTNGSSGRGFSITSSLFRQHLPLTTVWQSRTHHTCNLSKRVFVCDGASPPPVHWTPTSPLQRKHRILFQPCRHLMCVPVVSGAAFLWAMPTAVVAVRCGEFFCLFFWKANLLIWWLLLHIGPSAHCALYYIDGWRDNVSTCYCWKKMDLILRGCVFARKQCWKMRRQQLFCMMN